MGRSEAQPGIAVSPTDQRAVALHAFPADVTEGVVHPFTQILAAVALHELEVMRIDHGAFRGIDFEFMVTVNHRSVIEQNPDIPLDRRMNHRPGRIPVRQRGGVLDTRQGLLLYALGRANPHHLRLRLFLR